VDLRDSAVAAQESHLLADASLEGGQGQKVGIVGLGGLGHMGVVLTRWVPRRAVYYIGEQSRRWARLGADELSSRKCR
jgi:D-arabinose 1-dehydrogenase-like Zn-dependent alcohol dehydrogenase